MTLRDGMGREVGGRVIHEKPKLWSPLVSVIANLPACGL